MLCNTRVRLFIPHLWISAALAVHPDRSQFFVYDRVALTCGPPGCSGGWTLQRNTSTHAARTCPSAWGLATNGSGCVIDTVYPSDSGVYWCGSELRGRSSNSLNITVTGNVHADPARDFFFFFVAPERGRDSKVAAVFFCFRLGRDPAEPRAARDGGRPADAPLRVPGGAGGAAARRLLLQGRGDDRRSARGERDLCGGVAVRRRLLPVRGARAGGVPAELAGRER